MYSNASRYEENVNYYNPDKGKKIRILYKAYVTVKCLLDMSLNTLAEQEIICAKK